MSDLGKFAASHPQWLKGSSPNPEEYYIPKDHDLTTKTWDMISDSINFLIIESKSWPWQYENLISKDYCVKQYTRTKIKLNPY